MPNMSLSQARIKKLEPRRYAYEVRDAKLRSFGVRVLRSGAKRLGVDLELISGMFYKRSISFSL